MTAAAGGEVGHHAGVLETISVRWVSVLRTDLLATTQHRGSVGIHVHRSGDGVQRCNQVGRPQDAGGR